MSLSSFAKTLLAGAALTFVAASANADGIGVSLLTQQHPFYNELAKAITAEAKAKNVNAEIAIANQDLNKQLADIEDFIVKGVDTIIMSPVDSKGALAAVMRAQTSGIKVITVDVPVEGAKAASYIGTDNYAGGVKAGELMAEQLGGKGNVAIIDYPLVQSVVNRVNGFKDAIAKHPDIKIVSIQTGITRAEALAVAQNMLQANPDINGIFGFGDDAALAASVAVKSAGLAGKVKVIGFDGMPEAIKAVDSDPDMVGVIQQFPDQMGKLAVDTAVKLEAGETVPESQPIVPGVYTKK
ncbi:substrate-binding domain-containing protein [Rhizobium cauense]|uniref:substrate-binding domain-containing protein n=1 Tax=Rhizobium cauense TaxID=1166683 RepID=UPI001C6DEEEE|nr:substrate-binding domain-containing protein [Rhizobium cauense]MBW9116957.1 substrate-binding domain-containing protein [Rhizobium cauense]